MAKTPYSDDVAKWGRLARGILAQPHLLSLFKGIKKDEIEAISKTEEAAEAADRSQTKAFQALTAVTEEIKVVKERLVETFSTLKLRMPNVIKDLEKAGEKAAAASAREADFSTRATPRPQEISPEDKVTKPIIAAVTVPQEETDLEETVEEDAANDRESKAQGAIANAARRTANFFKDQPVVLAAVIARDMPATTAHDLERDGTLLLQLRDKRVLALVAWKRATSAEHKAVADHIEARGVVEPTLTKLTNLHDEINALAVEHLKRKSVR